ncbi:MAG TPA: 2-phospho-L-lactate transferase [Thermoanaerobaculia bacterium]|nr:2-phospho-L-lactate transferase [Thermoanaerobaculia bacterium]
MSRRARRDGAPGDQPPGDQPPGRGGGASPSRASSGLASREDGWPDLCLALSGGVGGAKLALGLSRVLAADRLVVVANTGDDFEHLGLHVAPDLDTVMYNLAGLANPTTGWGRESETWSFLGALEELGGETWFRLGDRDLAVHVERTRRLREGATLSQVTAELCARLGVAPRVAPMSDQAVRTMVGTPDGELAFQHYFVRDRCEPEVTGFRFAGIESARPSPVFAHALGDPALGAIVICPSNPFVSVDPILALTGVEDALRAAAAPIVAVSPIIVGAALKGPAAKMMRELRLPVTAVEVARHYADRGLLDGFVLDRQDEALAADLEALQVAVLVADTVMVTLDHRERLAREVLALARELS